MEDRIEKFTERVSQKGKKMPKKKKQLRDMEDKLRYLNM